MLAFSLTNQISRTGQTSKNLPKVHFNALNFLNQLIKKLYYYLIKPETLFINKKLDKK